MLQTLAAGGVVAVGAPLHAAAATCGAATSLVVPARGGFLGRLRPSAGETVVLDAGRAGALPRGIAHGPLAYRARRDGARFANPTLVVRRGDRLRVRVVNGLDAPTTVHWHGLTVDTRNDGLLPLIEPGGAYEYAFEVRNRGGLYWFHPHPHGATAGQVHDGLFGLLDVEDDEGIALRRALDIAPGAGETTLVLQDRRSAGRYVRSPAAAIHGFFGEAMFVNGSACATLDVDTRIHRLRIVNACNARTLLLGLKTATGRAVPFHVIGNDGGLLAAPVRTTAAFLASAERLDVLVDLRDAAVGDALVLETRAFDPMHAEVDMPADGDADAGHAAAAGADPHAAHGAAAAAVDPHAAHRASAAAADPHAGHQHGGEPGAASWPEGTPRDLVTLRVRRHVRVDRDLPTSLSAPLAAIDTTDARERPLRLGFKSGHWRINDRVFVMGETPIEVARGSTEVWLLRNYHTSMPHAMHLHGFAFEVQERETSPAQVAALAVDARGRLAADLGRKDTVLVWPGESVRVAIRFDLPFDGEQTYVFHCHNLEHEDGGMMLGVRVA